MGERSPFEIIVDALGVRADQLFNRQAAGILNDLSAAGFVLVRRQEVDDVRQMLQTLPKSVADKVAEEFRREGLRVIADPCVTK